MPKKQKQKQTQKQRQSVVVHIHNKGKATPRRRAPARRTGGGGGGGGTSVIYTNAPAYSYPPTFFPQIEPSLPNLTPTPTISNIPVIPTTTLQTPAEHENIPLLASAIKYTNNPMRAGINLEELKHKLSSPGKGLTPSKMNETKPSLKTNSPETPLIKAINSEKQRRLESPALKGEPEQPIPSKFFTERLPRRAKVEMIEARGMGLHDKPPKPVGRPRKVPFGVGDLFK